MDDARIDATTYRHITVKRLGAAAGAEIGGVDLALPLAPEMVEEIRRAFLAHHVVALRGQDVPPARQIEFTRHFGPVAPHPLYRSKVLEDNPEILVLEAKGGKFFNGRNDIWHADITFSPEPSRMTVLQCRAIEEGYGDTMFANQHLAYERLSPGLQRLLAGMQAEHSSRVLVERNNAAAENVPIAEIPPGIVHPVVRRHPDTGRQCLYVNPTFTERFVGMTRAESLPLLEYLYAHGTRPEFVYRHRWRVGDVVLFDNRCLWHYVCVDYGPEMHRLMHRTTANGDRPEA
jgi:taurine dioxygenase